MTTNALHHPVRPAQRPPRGGSEQGFTLIELLVVVVILGILIAIAIPVYLNYKKGANDKAAQADARNAVNVLEACFADNNAYPSAVTTGGGGSACTNRTITISSGTTFTYFPISASDLSAYVVGATSSGGSGKSYCFSSAKGGSVVATTTAVTGYRATC